MKKPYIFIGIGVVVIIFSSLAIFLNKGLFLQKIDYNETEVFEEKDVSREVILVVDDGTGELKNFEAEFEEGMTAFGLLKKKAEESGLVLSVKTYDMGVFVEAIGEKESGQDGKYWLYYVNGEMPMISVDKNEIKPGDKVEFRFEESSF
ncbi:DUF4430 domain-containing protein [Patescibacteria group bacterium]|nr:DUF4430 domain-containing protein [Patescibacteria group bacterium]